MIIYDQQCAAEKRRERSRGKAEEPTLRLVINEDVCEGCGDCVRQSNCMSLYPVSTEFGHKTRIHQSSCNKDYSCALGDCPSFVTVNLKKGTGLKRRPLPQLPAADVPPPREKAPIGEYYAILGRASAARAWSRSTRCWRPRPGSTASPPSRSTRRAWRRRAARWSRALFSASTRSRRPRRSDTATPTCCSASTFSALTATENLKRAHPSRTVAVVNTAEVPTGDAIRGRTHLAGPGRAVDIINTYTDRSRNVFVDASRIAEGLFASHLAVNVFLLGVAYQGGHIPLSAAAIEEAIRLNGAEADRNLAAFLWGRKYYHDARSVEDVLDPPKPKEQRPPTAEHRARELRDYQNAAYAAEYSQFVEKVAAKAPALEEPVARYLYKLMAYKDEYEVARLLTKRSLRAATGRHVGAGRIDRLQPASAAAAVAGLEEKAQARAVVRRSSAHARAA